MTAPLEALLQRLDRLTTAEVASSSCSVDSSVERRCRFVDSLQRVAEEWLSSGELRTKTRLQGLMSCIAVFSKINKVFGNLETDAADGIIVYLFQECARLLLQVECVRLKHSDPTLSLFRNIVESSAAQEISSKHRKYFELLKMLAEKPWKSPQLSTMLSQREPNKSCISGFVDELENAELVLLRIEALLEGNGADLAQRLINRFVKVKGNDVRLMSMLLILLYNADQCDEFHRQCTKLSCCMACDILHHMDETGLARKHQNAVLTASRTFFLLDWVKTTDLICTKVLMRCWLTAERHHFAKDEKEFCNSFNKVLSLTNCCDKLAVFIDVMESLFGLQYMTPCLHVALKVLRSARHRFTCAQLYVKDKSEVRSASMTLATVCTILSRYFHDHPQMRMTCLLSAACISPSNYHYLMLRSFFESSPDPVSLCPTAPLGVEWELYASLWYAVKYLQPPRFLLSTDWADINRNLRAYYYKFGWRFDSLAMAFKRNHNRQGIGCGLKGMIKLQRQKLKNNSEGKSAVYSKKLAKFRGKDRSVKTVNGGGDQFTTIAKKNSTYSALPFVLLKRLYHGLEAGCLDRCENERLENSASESNDSLHDTLVRMSKIVTAESEPGNCMTKTGIEKQKRRLNAAVKKNCVKRVAKETIAKNSFGVSGVCPQKSKCGVVKFVKNRRVYDAVSETDAMKSSAAQSPALSNDSEETIPLDNGDLNSCDTFHNFLESDPTQSDENKNCIVTENEDIVTNDRSQNNSNRSFARTSRIASDEESHDVPMKQSYLPECDSSIFLTKPEENSHGLFVKLQSALENCFCVKFQKDESKKEILQTSLAALPTSEPGEVSSVYLPLCPSLESEEPLPDEINMIQNNRNLPENGRDVEFSLPTDDLVMPVLSLATSTEGTIEVESLADFQAEGSETCDAQTFPADNGCDFPVSSLPLTSQQIESLNEVSMKFTKGGKKPKIFKMPFSCTHCPCVLYSNFALRQHLIRVHELGFRCYVCQKLVGSQWGLEIHISRMHGSEFRNLVCKKNGNGFKCRICSKTLPSAFGRRLHMARKHSIYEGRHCLNTMGINVTEPVANGDIEPSSDDMLKMDMRQGAALVFNAPPHRRMNTIHRNSKRKNSTRLRGLNTKMHLTIKISKISKRATPAYVTKLMKRSFMVKSKKRIKIKVKNKSTLLMASTAMRKTVNVCSEYIRKAHKLDGCSTSTCRQIDSGKGVGVLEKYQLKDCFVSLERLRLAEVKLRSCHVSVKRLNCVIDDVDNYWKNADVVSVSSESELSSPDEGISSSVYCNESSLPFEANDATLKMERVNDAIKLDASSAEMTGNMYDVPSKTSNEPMEKFYGENQIISTQCSSCSSLSGICIWKPLVCNKCMMSYSSCKEFALHHCPKSHFPLGQPKSDLKAQNAELEEKNCVCLRLDEKEIVKVSCTNLLTPDAQSSINNSTSCQEENPNELSKRKCLPKRKVDCFGDPNVMKNSAVSRIAFRKLSDKKYQGLHKVNLKSAKLQNFGSEKVKTCQVKLIPLKSANIETPVTTSCSCLPDLTPRRLGDRNLFESFEKAVMQSMRGNSKESSRLLHAYKLFNTASNGIIQCIDKLCLKNLANDQQLSGAHLSQAEKESSMQLSDLSASSTISSDLSSLAKLYYSESSEPVSFPDKPDSSTVTGRSAPSNIAQTNDVCVISSDEEDEVQVIDLDGINVYHSSSRNVQGDERRGFKQSSGSRKRDGKTRETKRNNHSSCKSLVANDVSVSDVYMCKLCEKSFHNMELLIRHRDRTHKQVNTAETQNSCSTPTYSRDSGQSCVNLNNTMSNLSEIGFGFYCVSPAFRNLKLGFRESSAKKQTSSLASGLSSKVKGNKMGRIAESCHLASPSKIHSVGSCDAMKSNSVTRNVLVIGQT